jgi:hypothetical protein
MRKMELFKETIFEEIFSCIGGILKSSNLKGRRVAVDLSFFNAGKLSAARSHVHRSVQYINHDRVGEFRQEDFSSS